MTVETGHGIMQRHVLKFLMPVWFFLICVAVFAGFLHLDANSLWMDELFTVYFADPTQPDFAAFLARAAEDVHPPGYYAIVWTVGQFTSADITIVARAISAVAAALSLVLIYFTLPSWVGKPARLFTCTFAASSLSFFVYSQEARSYAVSWVLLIVLLAIARRIMKASAHAKPIMWHLAIFAVVGAIAALTHFYLVPVTGAIVFVLICYGRTWPNRFAIALTGLVILAVALTFIWWHADKIVADLSNIWFKSDAEFLWRHLKFGVTLLRGSLLEYFLGNLIVLAGLACSASAWAKKRATINFKAVYGDVALYLGTAVLGVLLAIMVTILYKPSFSYRFLLILAPVYWIMLALLIESFLRCPLKNSVNVLLVSATVMFALTGLRVTLRDVPRNPDWRAAANFVDTLHGCEHAELPVLVFENAYIREDEAVHFYGYYMADPQQREWLAYPRDAIAIFPGSGHARDIVAERITGDDPCPLLVWGVDHATHAQFEDLRTAIPTRFDVPEGAKITLKTIHLQESTWLMRLLSVAPSKAAYLLLVER